MTFHDICRLDELPSGTALRVEVDGADVCLVHTRGQVFAIDDTCSHAEVSLSEGDVDGCFIECWLHGSRFDLRNGEPTSPPATEPVTAYAARVIAVDGHAVVQVSVDFADRVERDCGDPQVNRASTEQQQTSGVRSRQVEGASPRQIGNREWSN